MKVALLIAGYLRNYANNVESVKEILLKKYSKVDVYLHITKDENREDKYFNLIENILRYINQIHQSLGSFDKTILPSELPALKKLRGN